MIGFEILDSASFLASTKEEDTLYFLEDTKEIYKGEDCYNKNVYFVTEFPKFAIRDKFYINSLTSECRLWNGKQWITLMPTITNTLEDGKACDSLVTGNAIKKYISNTLIEFEKKFNKTETGALSTDNITLSKDIRINQNMGNYKIGDVIKAGTTLTDIITNQMVYREQVTYKAPQLFIRPSAQILECGSILDSTITAQYEKNDGGEVKKYYLDRLLNGDTTTLVSDTSIVSYKNDDWTVTDTDDLKFKATVEYREGNIKRDNLGDMQPQGHITEGKVSSEMSIIGRRKSFYASAQFKDAKTKTIDSTYIRSLANSKLNLQNGATITMSVKTGDNLLVIAIPRQLNGISKVHSNVLGLDVTDAFELTTDIKVEGANHYNATEYKVYIYKPDIGFVNDDTYVITF